MIEFFFVVVVKLRNSVQKNSSLQSHLKAASDGLQDGKDSRHQQQSPASQADQGGHGIARQSKHRFALPEEVRVPEVKEAARFEWNRACKVLEARLEGEFVMGDRLTVPDIVLGQCAGWAKNARFDWPEGPVGAYFERLQGREALERARQKGKAAAEAALG